MKHYITKYSSKQLKEIKAKRDASKHRSHPALGPAAIVSDMDDIHNHTARMQAQAEQIQDCGDVLWA